MNALCNIYKIYLQSQSFDPLPIDDINIYSTERDFYFIIERIYAITCTCFLPWSLKTKQDWPGMTFVYVLSVSQTFGIGVYIKPYY